MLSATPRPVILSRPHDLRLYGAEHFAAQIGDSPGVSASLNVGTRFIPFSHANAFLVMGGGASGSRACHTRLPQEHQLDAGASEGAGTHVNSALVFQNMC